MNGALYRVQGMHLSFYVAFIDCPKGNKASELPNQWCFSREVWYGLWQNPWQVTFRARRLLVAQLYKYYIRNSETCPRILNPSLRRSLNAILSCKAIAVSPTQPSKGNTWSEGQTPNTGDSGQVGVSTLVSTVFPVVSATQCS